MSVGVCIVCWIVWKSAELRESLAEQNGGQNKIRSDDGCKTRQLESSDWTNLPSTLSHSQTAASLCVCVLLTICWDLARFPYFSCFSLTFPHFFHSNKTHIWTRGSFIFSSIYVPEQEPPPTEKYCFLLALLLLLLHFVLMHSRTCLHHYTPRSVPVCGCCCCVCAGQTTMDQLCFWVCD